MLTKLTQIIAGDDKAMISNPLALPPVKLTGPDLVPTATVNQPNIPTSLVLASASHPSLEDKSEIEVLSTHPRAHFRQR